MRLEGGEKNEAEYLPRRCGGGVHAARTRSDKGSRRALAELGDLLAGGTPVLFAVDGPRGPRNRVNRGVAVLSHRAGAPILPTLVLPSRRWFLAKAWDRFQIPKPFTTVSLIFGEPILPREGEDSEALRLRVSQAINSLEWEHDPEEAERAHTARRRLTPSLIVSRDVDPDEPQQKVEKLERVQTRPHRH